MQNNTARIAARDTAEAQSRYLNETMARSLKPVMPLPPWPKRKRPLPGRVTDGTIKAMLKRVGL